MDRASAYGLTVQSLGPGSKETDYLYAPLQSPDSFRFVVLKAGTGQDPIECELVIKIIKQKEDDAAKPHWEAISWVWGAYGDRQAINVDGRKFYITRSLYIALRHLRKAGDDRLLWVDALCINQADIVERNLQISKMAFLFHRAHRVIAWLGEGTPGSQVFMMLARYLQDFESGHLSSCSENIMYTLALTFGVPKIKANLSNSFFNYWNIHKFENWCHIDSMADQELFRRSWVLQESALARNLFVACGTETISWNAFYRAVSLRHSQDGRFRGFSNVGQGWSAMQAIESLRQLVATRQHPPDLLELLWACRNYKSTDPRDRIFALLGISDLLYGHSPERQLGFEIDYSRSVVDIFRSFTISMIAKYVDLRVLATRRSNRTLDDRRLGSWCPDWASLDHGVSLLYRQQQWSANMVHYNASGHSLPVSDADAWASASKHAVEKGGLSLRGFKLDTIKRVRHTSHFESDNTRLYDWYHWATWPDEREWTEIPHPRGETLPQRQDAFWRTVIADADANGNRHPVYLRAQFQTWYQKIVEGFNTSNDFAIETSAGEDYMDFLSRMREVTKGRCLFETSAYGFLGIGDEDYISEHGGPQLKAGYVVAILHGGPLPVLLQEVQSRAQSYTKPTYRLVGDAFCYVHGMVDGEAMQLCIDTEDFLII